MIMSDLPSDLEEEVLTRVPTTTLKRLGSTCKRWNALFKDRRFTKRHFRKAAKQSLVLLMLKKFRTFSMSDSLKTLNVADSSIEFKVPLDPKDSHSNLEQVDIVQAFHCGGLLLFTTKGDRLVVWNPCLGETRWIQIKTDYGTCYESGFSLGYENNKFGHSYKILRYYHQEDKLVGSEIYDFSSDSWRVLLDVVALDCFIISLSQGVCLKGNAYWLAFDKTYSKSLLSFDFTRERFRRLCLPAFQNHCWTALSVVREEQLSVLHRSYGTSKIDMWVTNKIDTEAALWIKSFTVNTPNDEYIPTSTFLIDEEKKVVVCCNASFEPISVKLVYIIEKHYTESHSVETTHISEFPSIFSYVPSLAQIQQVEEEQNKSRN